MMQTLVGDLVIHEVHHPAKIQQKLLEILRGHGAAVTTNDPYGSDSDTTDDGREDPRNNDRNDMRDEIYEEN